MPVPHFINVKVTVRKSKQEDEDLKIYLINKNLSKLERLGLGYNYANFPLVKKKNFIHATRFCSTKLGTNELWVISE